MMEKHTLKELAERATSGPWIIGKAYCEITWGVVHGLSTGHAVIVGDNAIENQAYIAAANPQAVLALLEAKRAALAKTDALLAEVERLRNLSESADKLITGLMYELVKARALAKEKP